MYIYGKLFGGLFGALIAGPFGLILGVLVGHAFDKGIAAHMAFWGPDVELAKKVFFKTTFLIMGYIAKSDGRVSEEEIQAARSVMAHLQLDQEQKLSAISYFNQGKSQQFKFDSVMDNFVRNCGHQPQLVQLFVEIQVQAALVDGIYNPAKKRYLERLCDKLHIPRAIITQLAGARAYQATGSSEQKRHYQPPPRPAPIDELASAYGLLGATANEADDVIKKKYRKLMSENHPDKLVAKGLPAEMVKAANEKTQRIRRAYELVAKARGMK